MNELSESNAVIALGVDGQEGRFSVTVLSHSSSSSLASVTLIAGVKDGRIVHAKHK